MGLSYALKAKENLTVTGEAENGQEAIRLVRKSQPDIVLMDIVMPVMDGVTATQHLKEDFPHIKIIMLTSSTQEEEVFASLAAGAEAYCLKDIRMEKLFQVIDLVLDGGVWLDPLIAGVVLKTLPGNNGQDSSDGKRHGYNVSLTVRELEVLTQIVEGKSNKEIAGVLTISLHTVKTHVCNIIQKLAVDDRTQAAVKALQSGLIVCEA